MRAKIVSVLCASALAACNPAQTVPKDDAPTIKIIRSGPCNGVLELAHAGAFTAARMDDGADGFLVDATPDMISCAEANNIPQSFTMPAFGQ